MRRYETIAIVDPDLSDDDRNQVLERITNLIPKEDGFLIMLDEWGIYGTNIYILWNDKCGRDTRKMLMLIRAVQLGKFSHEKLIQMAGDQKREINLSDDEFDELDKIVCDELEEFERPQ